MTKILLKTLDVFTRVQHTDRERMPQIMEAVLLDIAHFQNPFEMLINRPPYQALAKLVREHKIPLVLPIRGKHR